MQVKKIELLFLLVLFCAKANAQVDLATIDTSRWKVDTIAKSLTITPKFDFVNDTTTYFYSRFKKKREKIVTLNYVHGKKCIIGTFNGTSRYPNSNIFLQLNFNQRPLDSLGFLSLVDTIISTEFGRSYCINIKNLGIKDSVNSIELQSCCFNIYDGYFTIAVQVKVQDFPTSCFAGVVMVQRNEPPYDKCDLTWDTEMRK